MADENVEFAGQKIPTRWLKTWPGVWIVGAICVASCIVIYIILVAAKPPNLHEVRGVFTAGFYQKNGETNDDSPVTIYKFWTPNKDTKRDFLGLTNGYPESNIVKTDVPPYYWVSDDGEPEIKAFIAKLELADVNGYDYVLTWGRGTTKLKRGYTWEVTIDAESPVSRKAFIKMYAESWQRETNIWLEEFHVASWRENAK